MSKIHEITFVNREWKYGSLHWFQRTQHKIYRPTVHLMKEIIIGSPSIDWLQHPFDKFRDVKPSFENQSNWILRLLNTIHWNCLNEAYNKKILHTVDLYHSSSLETSWRKICKCPIGVQVPIASWTSDLFWPTHLCWSSNLYRSPSSSLQYL